MSSAAAASRAINYRAPYYLWVDEDGDAFVIHYCRSSSQWIGTQDGDFVFRTDTLPQGSVLITEAPVPATRRAVLLSFAI